MSIKITSNYFHFLNYCELLNLAILYKFLDNSFTIMLKIETLSPKYYNFLFYLTFKGFFFHDFQVANLIFI